MFNTYIINVRSYLMKLIGVMGNSGSGKTTFTEHLGKRENVGVIHVDDLVGDVKRRYFKLFLQPEKNNTTESTKANPKLKSGSKKFFYRNRITFNFLMLVRSKLVEKELTKQIEMYKRDGKGLIIIDDWALVTHKKLLPKINHIYAINRDFLTRRKGVQERDDLSTEELKVNDLPYSLKFIKPPIGENASVIQNNGTIEDLYELADLEYERLGELTFDEKYSLRGRINVRDINKKIDKLHPTREYSKESK